MNQMVLLTFAFNLVILWSANAVRVSPKLDFGDSPSDKKSAGIRPSFDSTYQRDGGLTRYTYTREDTNSAKTDNVEVICVSGNCNTTKAKGDSDGGISADVLVHIKTNVDVAKNRSSTVEPVPDVPVVVGTKTSSISTLDYNRPFGIQGSVISPSVNPNYRTIDPLPPISTNNQFVPSIPTFFQNTGLQSDSQVRSFNGANNYAPRFHGNSNGIDFQTTSFESRFNANGNNLGVTSSTWYPRRSGSGVGGYNPVEFKKTYSNAWTPIQWTRSNSAGHERRNVGIPRWTPCVCQNSEAHNLPTTPNYPSPNQPAGINGKLGSLI